MKGERGLLKEKEALTKRLLTKEKQADNNFDLLESKEAELKDTKAELENLLRKANNIDEGAIGLEADLISAKKQQHAAEKDWKRMTTVNEDQIYDLRQETKGLKYKLALMEDEKSD
jgi:predicted  nucleic acid-binding Zn-ribbon protein